MFSTSSGYLCRPKINYFKVICSESMPKNVVNCETSLKLKFDIEKE